MTGKQIPSLGVERAPAYSHPFGRGADHPLRSRQRWRGPIRRADFGYRAFTFCGASFQTLRSSSALSAFARRYSRNRGCFLFLCLLRCFTSARSLPTPMHSAQGTPKGGLPHSDTPGSRLGYQLPWAFRRFLRPSSPLDAKTSTVCPFAWSG